MKAFNLNKSKENVYQKMTPRDRLKIDIDLMKKINVLIRNNLDKFKEIKIFFYYVHSMHQFTKVYGISLINLK